MYNSSAEEILEFLEDNSIYSLWHFTDIGNLQGIKKRNGLRSKEFLEDADDVNFGGNEDSHRLDMDKNNWDKVSLSYTPHTPMTFRRKKERHLVFIEIDPVVATFDGVCFTDRNATRLRDGQKRGKGIEGLRNVKFEYIHSVPKPYDPDWVKYVQAEVLVPNHIPLDYFKGIHFISEASLKLGEYLWEGDHPPFIVNPRIFADYINGSWKISNPYIEKVIIADKEITKNNVENAYLAIESIKINKKYWMKIYMSAIAGTKIKIILKDLQDNIIKEEEKELDKSYKFYKWWLTNFQLPAEYSYPEVIFEIFLNEILWYKEKRKVLK